MSQSSLPLPQARTLGQTSRKDKWWLAPLLVFLGLSAFIVYSTWAAFQGAHYTWGPYLSPMYSPLIFNAGTEWGAAHPSTHAWFGNWPAWWPAALAWMASPALLILGGPAGFRFTCYYYRGAYYKAFWGDPINCGVGEPRNEYRGEHKWPLIFQNLHRYMFYIAAAYIVVLAYDAGVAMVWDVTDADGVVTGHTFGIGVGTLVMVLNVILLGGYTFGCHVFRHLIAGVRDTFSDQPKVRTRCYDCVSCLNRNHMKWAWFSLVWVGFTDFYIRMVAMGVWTDWRII